MPDKENQKFTPVDTKPVKRFFVEMLTRDIALADAILDLLDNCVDGILRSQQATDTEEKPYEGFWAHITVTGDRFEIEDNCGGIPWSSHERAFRMGRPAPKPGEDKDENGLERRRLRHRNEESNLQTGARGGNPDSEQE